MHTPITTHGTFSDWQERIQVWQRISTILSTYSFEGDKGLCTDCGKHEGNPVATIYYWDCALDGDGEDMGQTTVHEATAVEMEIFGAMAGCVHYSVSQDDNGFVYGSWVKPNSVDYLRSRYEEGLADAE